MSQELRSYTPSLREKIAYWLANGAESLGAGVNTQRKIIGKAKDVVDFVPVVGDAVGFNDASRDIQAGNYGAGAAGLGLAALGLIPGAGDMASKVGKKTVENLHPLAKAAAMSYSPKLAARETGLTQEQVRAIRELQGKRREAQSFVDPLIDASKKRPYMTPSAIEKREQEYRQFLEISNKQKAESLARLKAEISREEGVRNTMSALAKNAKNQGMIVRNSKSKSGDISSYYAKVPNGPQIRISDHEIPWTNEREMKALMAGQTGFNGYNGAQITISKPHSETWINRALLLAKNNRSVLGGQGIAGASAMLGYNVLGGVNETQAGELTKADAQFNGGGNMIEVELPDGTIAEFPEGTSPDVIKGALQKRFAAPQPVAPVVDQAGQDRAAYNELPWYAKAGQAADDVMRLAANGATFGYADKLAGYMSGDGTESERVLTESARNRAGSAAPVAEIGGSVLTAGGLAKNGLTLAGRGGTAAMTGLKGLAARAGLMGLEGEAFNKVSSMGYDQEYVPGLGVVAGAGGQVAGEGLSAGLTKIGKSLGNYLAPAESRAAQEIYDAAQNVNPQAALAQLNDLGPDAMAVDVLGERGIALGRRAANLSPDARETIESAVLGRKSMQNQRIVADLEKASGLPVGNRMNVDALKKEAYDQVAPQINAAYDAARKAGYDLPREPFRSVLESPLGKEAYQNAEGALLNRAAASGQTSASELARLDQTKRFLDSTAKKAFRAGDDDVGSQAAALAKALRDQMDTSIAGPEYAAARALRQKAYGTEGAFDLGETLASGRVPFGLPEQASKVAAGDKAALAKGYAAKQAENLLNRGSTEGALNQLSTPMGREGFIAALGDKAPEIIKALGREKTFNRAAKGLTGNSTTARQVAEMMGTGVGSAAAAGAMGYDMTTGGTMGLVAALLKKGGPALQRKFASEASRQVAPHLADLLTRKALPATRPIAANAIEKLSEGSKQAIIRALMMSGVLAGSQAGQP